MLNVLSKNKYLWLMAVFVLSVVFPDIAFAGPFDPPGGDKSKEIIIDNLFGPISGGGDSPLSGVIGIFNTAVLLVGGILVAYTLIAGTMQTAHDGEMMGKRWSSLWIPVRTALGVAAILPVKSGFCFAQIAVVWLALQGVGIADAVWSRFVTDQTSQAQTYIPPGATRPIRLLLNQMLKGSACVKAANEQARLTDASILGVANEVSTSSEAAGIKYGPLNVCGRVVLAPPPNEKDIQGDLGKFFNKKQFESVLFPIQQQQLMAAHAKVEQLAEKIAKGDKTNQELSAEVNAALDQQAQVWSDALATAAQAAYQKSTSQNLVQEIVTDGWLMAGMWYVQFATAQDAVSRGITAIPSASVPPGDYISNTLRVGPIDARAAKRAIESVEEIVSSTKIKGSNAVENYGNDQSSFTAKFIEFFINDDLNFIGGFSEGTQLNQNPVLMASNLGSNLSVWGWGAYITGVAVGTLTGSLTGFATMISPMLTAIAGTIIVAGATLSTYIPMLPYILWIGVAFGWAVLLVEAVIAAPLWAVTHLAPDGDGVVGRGGQGYMLVLSLTLRPALMVLGFASAVVLMQPIGYIVNSTFFGAFVANVNPSLTSLGQIVTGCVIYTMLMVSIITRIFALIHVVPDRLLRWIGGGGSNELGQEAHGIESHTGAKAVAGVAAAQTIGQSAQQGIQNAKNLKAHEKGKLSSDAAGASQEASGRADAATRAGNDFNDAKRDLENNPSPENAQRLDDATEAMQQTQFSAAKAEARSAIAQAKAAPKSDTAAQAKGQEAQAFLDRANAHVSSNGQSGQSLRSFANAERKSGMNSPSSPWAQSMNKLDSSSAQASASHHNARMSQIRAQNEGAPDGSGGPGSGGGQDAQGDFFDNNNSDFDPVDGVRESGGAGGSNNSDVTPRAPMGGDKPAGQSGRGPGTAGPNRESRSTPSPRDRRDE